MPQRCDASRVWTPDYLERIASLLGPNETACLRLVNNAAAECFSDAAFTISQPVPRWAFQQRWEPPRSCRALTTSQRVDLIHLTASSNDIPNLEVALTAAGVKLLPGLTLPAAAAGAMHASRYLSERLGAAVPWTDIAKAAAGKGQGAVVRWALAHVTASGGNPPVWEAAGSAARGGHVGLLYRLLAEARATVARAAAARTEARAAARQVGCELEAAAGSNDGGYEGGVGVEDAEEDENQEDVEEEEEQEEDDGCVAKCGRGVIIDAMAGCDLATVQRLIGSELGGPGGLSGWSGVEQESAMTNALKSLTPDWVAKADLVFAAKPGISCSQWYFTMALRLGGEGLERRFEWLKANRFVPAKAWNPEEVMRTTAAGGSLAALQWLLAEGLSVDAAMQLELSSAAAGGGHVEVLRFMHKAHWCLNPPALGEEAARCGHLPVLEWLWETFPGFAPSSRAFCNACDTGCSEVMRWTSEHQHEAALAPELRRLHFSPKLWNLAARSGSKAACELLAELGCPNPDNGEPYLPALWLGPREQQAWWLYPVLKRLGLPYGNLGPRLFMGALERGAPLGLLRQLVAEGFPVPSWAEIRLALFKRVPYADDADVAAWVEGQLERERLERQS